MKWNSSIVSNIKTPLVLLLLAGCLQKGSLKEKYVKALSLGDRGKVEKMPFSSLSLQEKNNLLFFLLEKEDLPEREYFFSYFVEKGAPISFLDTQGRCLLHAAVRSPFLLKKLIEEKSHLEIRDNQGYTPLMWAAMQGNPESVSLLLDAGARIYTPGFDGKNAFLLSIERAAFEKESPQSLYILELFLKKGADPNLLFRDKEGKIFTALQKVKALKLKKTEMVILAFSAE